MTLVFCKYAQIIHSRTGFEDSSQQQRHLLRLWLSLDSPKVQWPWSNVDQDVNSSISIAELASSTFNGISFVIDLISCFFQQRG